MKSEIERIYMHTGSINKGICHIQHNILTTYNICIADIMENFYVEFAN